MNKSGALGIMKNYPGPVGYEKMSWGGRGKDAPSNRRDPGTSELSILKDKPTPQPTDLQNT